jgi:hypothetical protein
MSTRKFVNLLQQCRTLSGLCQAAFVSEVSERVDLKFCQLTDVYSHLALAYNK